MSTSPKTAQPNAKQAPEKEHELVSRTMLASHLVLFAFESYEGDDIALDIIEFIAVRMPDRSAADVRAVGFYVRQALIDYCVGDCSFGDTLDDLYSAAVTAGATGHFADPTLH